jgi:NADPH:quinone reductase-like Zn-dependent oxidoreductase
MRAVVVSKHGGPEVLQVQEMPDPPVGPGEVRIAVKAAGINFAETVARMGLYPDAPPLPCVMGYEVAGDVESVGEGVEDLKVGDPVFAGTRFGGHAELVTVPADLAFPLPQAFSYEEATAFPVNYVTAQAGLVTMGGLEEGDRVLVHAAAGGVGIAATQIAKLRGAEVFGTASASKHDAIREQGVDHAIDYRNLDYAEEVMRITGGEGVDVILDALGPTSARKGYKILRPGGCLIVYGASEVSTGETRNLLAVGRAVLTAPFATIPWWKSVGIINENKGVFGLNMLHWLDTEGSLDRVIRPLMAELEKGSIRPVVSEVFRFDQAADAHRFIGERRNVGKVVLVP